jgi:hypothetical protein
MVKTKYGKYIISELKPPRVEAPWSPPNIKVAGKGKGGRVLYTDDDVIPGSFYTECVWVTPRPPLDPKTIKNKTAGTQPHTHDYDEIIAFFGTDLNNPYDLGAEVELWLGDEKHIITKTSLVFIPAGLQHGPLYFLKVWRTVFHFTTGTSKVYF